MATEIITKDDLDEFRIKHLTDIKALLGKSETEPGKLLKSYHVKIYQNTTGERCKT